MVTHPSTNRAQRRVTSSMRQTTLPLYAKPRTRTKKNATQYPYSHSTMRHGWK